MVVLSIAFALALTQCDSTLQPVVLALKQNDAAGASSLLSSVTGECLRSSSYFALTGMTDELSGKGADAETAFLKAIELDPKSARLKEQLGAVYLRNNKPDLAAGILREAIVLDPGNPTAKKYLIGAYAGTGSWSNAATLFDRLGEKVSGASDPILVLWFARALIETKQFSRLDRDLSPDTAVMPSALLFSLGGLFAEHGLYEMAAKYLHRIPEADADDAVYFNLGLAYSHLRKYDDARENYFLAIDKHPEHSDAYFRVGLDYAAGGDARKALPWLFRAHQLDLSRPEVSYALIEQLIQLNYTDSAQEILNNSAGANAADPLVSVAGGDLRLAQGNTQEARNLYRNTLARQPAFPPALIGLARTYIAEGNDSAARPNLIAALAKGPENAPANGELGSIEARQGDWSSALRHLEKAWTHDNSDSKIALALARADRHMDKPGDALKLLITLEPVMQQSSAYHLELAQVYGQLHRTIEAQAEREAAARLQADAQKGLRFDNPKVYVH